QVRGPGCEKRKPESFGIGSRGRRSDPRGEMASGADFCQSGTPNSTGVCALNRIRTAHGEGLFELQQRSVPCEGSAPGFSRAGGASLKPCASVGLKDITNRADPDGLVIAPYQKHSG